MNLLPYELQFKILSELSPSDIHRYCQADQAAWQIWLAPAFWNERARLDFGLDLDHVEGRTPFHQYQELQRLEREEPAVMLILAISHQRREQIPRYLLRVKRRPHHQSLLTSIAEFMRDGQRDHQKEVSRRLQR